MIMGASLAFLFFSPPFFHLILYLSSRVIKFNSPFIISALWLISGVSAFFVVTFLSQQARRHQGAVFCCCICSFSYLCFCCCRLLIRHLGIAYVMVWLLIVARFQVTLAFWCVTICVRVYMRVFFFIAFPSFGLGKCKPFYCWFLFWKCVLLGFGVSGVLHVLFWDKHCSLVSWCFEPSHPQSITSGLITNSTLSPSHSFHKSLYHKSYFF